MSAVLTSVQAKPHNPMAAVMASRSFRLLWIGQGTSLLGDQFYLIAMPWLVLQRTGDPLALGAVLALAGLPRAIFMLVGGAMTDRFSPRLVMLVSDLIRLALMAGLTILVLAHSTEIWTLWVFSLVFGIAAGFFLPASNAILPRLVGKENLQAGNAISQGTGQLTQFVGPVLAGGLIAWAGHNLHFATGSSVSQGLEGAALAFAFDACTFLVSVITLWRMDVPVHPQAAAPEKVLESIGSGLRQFWQDTFIRFVLVMMACGSLLFTGSLMVGIPVLASTRLSGGASAFGILMSAYAAGSLLGIIAAGALPKPDASRLMGLLTGLNLITALAWLAMMGMTSTGLASAVMLLMGLGMGYQAIIFFTALQRRVPRHLLGRLMSLVLLFNVGLTPVSQALAGALIKWSLTGLFGLTGGLFIVLILWASFKPEYQMVGEILTTRQSGD
ncbi:MAG TPA: MFS transporter [Aggregatilineaceae bacterium]|nr:MFS transporter [Aggregatilineaceae bacterium]